ncbi:MAG: DUF1329 domain-containing protein [Desulfobacterales bacterium]|nr:DUF1329 domain-containing protein [Desulfobacterales bacterium]
MRLFNILINHAFIFFTVIFIVPVALAGRIDPESYMPRPGELAKYKMIFDDPRSMMDELHPSKMLPPEVWAKLQWDIDEMKSLWAEIVGFKSSDVVGKIAPEIKPGKYTYTDLEKQPGLKELMIPEMLTFIKPGGPPHAGNIPEFEIVPTSHYYYSLPIARATKKNAGKANLDKQGYIIDDSWDGGYPFPKPSGKFKAQQVIINYYQKYWQWGNNYRLMGRSCGIDKNMKHDISSLFSLDGIRFSKRVLMQPLGWYDKRAQKNGEGAGSLISTLSPRDIKGTAVLAYNYENSSKFNQTMLYVPSLRRIRKMSSTDSQDPINGQDLIYDDQDGFNQKLTPDRYPYKYEIVAEREYLVPFTDGTEYIDTKDGYAYKNYKFERRPMYAIKMTQLDPNYIYGMRMIYIDAETFCSTQYYNYDQKERLYRGNNLMLGFLPESGMLVGNGSTVIQRDYIDFHTTCVQLFTVPCFWGRDQFSLKKMMQLAK